MEVVLTSRKNLLRKYGADGLGSIEESLNHLIDARRREGIDCRLKVKGKC